ncbi:hypothetical protein [uncultured Marivirga sp.]|uniref:hypothetical protein n=1 Tax=uncultured Marivirga sp. TaxID=1123707 RepID=UPI0030EF2F25
MKPLFPSNEIHWLRYISKAEDQNAHLVNHHYHYWSEYFNAQGILCAINPDVIIIMDNKSPLSIALIYAAKKSKIPVYYLQHGVLASFKDYKILEGNLKKIDKNRIEKLSELKANAGFSTLSFFRNSLGSRFFNPKIFLYLFVAKKYGERTAAYLIKDKIRIPDKYLCFSKENAQLNIELDGDIENKIHIVGFPELEKIVTEYEKLANQSLDSDYWLHIDQPLSGGDLGEDFISHKEHHDIYLALSKKAAQHNCKLYVKLHPGSFANQNLPIDNNIIWLKEVGSLASLIKGAKICSGFYSSLLLCCIAFKPTLLYKIFDISWYKNMSKYSNVQIINDMKGLENLNTLPPNPSSSETSSFLKQNGYFENEYFEEKLIRNLNS